MSPSLAHPPVAPPDPALLHRILASPDLAHAHDTSGLLSRLIAAIVNFLGDLLGSHGVITGASIVRTVFFVAVGAVALWLLVRALRRLSPAPRKAPAAQPAREKLASAAALRALAERARAAGDLRTAMREHFLAALAHLEAEGLVGRGRSKTDREYVDDLAGRSPPAPLESAFASLVEAYDARFYGLAEIGEPDVDAVASAADVVLAEADAARRAA